MDNFFKKIENETYRLLPYSHVQVYQLDDFEVEAHIEYFYCGEKIEERIKIDLDSIGRDHIHAVFVAWQIVNKLRELGKKGV